MELKLFINNMHVTFTNLKNLNIYANIITEP